MTLPGGAADKAGNSYERRWTILALLDLLLGKAQSVRIEVPGDEGAGAEFRVMEHDVAIWHQAKRQRSGGPWTVTNMMKEKLLATAWDKVQAGGRYLFVSGTSADELKILTKRAADAESADEFETEFLKAKEHKSRVEELRKHWGVVSVEAAYLALRAITVRTVDEEALQDQVEARLESLVTGRPAVAAAVLAQLVDDSCHKTLTAYEVRARLHREGIRERRLSNDTAVVGRLAEILDLHLHALRLRHIAGRELPRAESQEAFAALVHSRRVLLTGSAGQGKSVIAGQVAVMARSVGWPVLAISADRIEDSTAHRVGEAMGLPDSPVTILAAVAAGGEALLIVDQLDALSIASGRHPERLAVIGDLLGQAALHPQVRVLMVTRDFDLDNDRQLRAVATPDQATVLRVGPLPADDIRGILTGEHLDPNPPDQLAALLAVPLHLALYTEIARSGEAPAGARDLNDLYDAYWSIKRAACAQRAQDAEGWLPAVRRIVESMNAAETLVVPTVALDDVATYVEVMASEGVVAVRDGRVSFTHETFLDYCQARLFITDGRTLRDELSWSAQGLFRRSQVRQILSYQRSKSYDKYLTDLAWLTTGAEVRPHVKALAISLAQTVPDPRPEEWAILKPIAEDRGHAFHERLWRALRRNPAWFSVIGADWDAWLASPDPAVIDEALWAMSGMAPAEPEATVRLVRRLPADDALPGRLRRFLGIAPLHVGLPLADLLIGAVHEGLYDNDAGDLWHLLWPLVKQRPDWVVEAISAVFARELGNGAVNPFKGTGPLSADRQSLADEVIAGAASGAPVQFAAAVVPHLLEIARRNTLYDEEGRATAREGVWYFRFFGEAYGLSNVCYHETANALRASVSLDPDETHPVLLLLRDDLHESSWFLLARAYAANPACYADEAAVWLAGNQAALRLGYSASPSWVSRELIAAITPHCSEDAFRLLVDKLIGYTPPEERTYDARSYRGSTELCLLNGVDEARRAERLTRRLAELRRKFLREDVPPPQRTWAGSIPPPIPATQARKMTDEQWLRAMGRYASSDVRFVQSGRLVGDAASQAQVLETVTTEEPERFARLCLGLGPPVPEVYLVGVLRGLASAVIGTDLLLEVCRHAHDVGGDDTRREILRLIEAHAAASLSEELLELAASIATESASPVDPADTDEQERVVVAMNSTRGTAAQAIAALIAHDPGRLAKLQGPLQRLVRDASTSVRVLTISALTTLLDVDPDLALSEFLEVVKDPEVLASRYVERFLNTAVVGGHHAAVADVLRRMIASPNLDLRRVGARQLAVASYLDRDLNADVDHLLEDDEVCRSAVVEVFAHNVGHAAMRQRAFDILAAAFNDASPDVQAAASKCFHRMDEQGLAGYGPLIGAFAAGSAVAKHAGTVLHVLERARQPLPVEVLALCERVAVPPAGDALLPRAFRAGTETYVIQLAVRLYAQHSNSDLRDRCLDLIDQLVLIDIPEVEGHLDTIER